MAYEVPFLPPATQALLNPLDVQAKSFELGQQQLEAQRKTKAYEQGQQTQRALQDAFQSADTSTPEGQADLVRKVGRIDPNAALNLQSQFLTQSKTRAELGEIGARTQKEREATLKTQGEIAQQKRETMTGFIGDANQALSNISTIIPDKTILPGTTTYKERMDRANKMVDEWSSIMKSKYADSPEIRGFIEQIDSHDWQTPEEFRNHLGMFQKLQALAKQQAPLTNVGKANADIASGAVTPQQGQSLIERETAPPGVLSPAAEAQRIRIQRAGAETRADLRETPEEAAAKAEAVTAARGRAKLDVSLAGGRESIYNQRVINSGNQSAKALHNLSRLPITASTGLFGSGRHQGASMLDASKEALATESTGEWDQLYGIMVAGLQRSLAGIESMGLAPSGALTKQMDAVVTNPGHTGLARLSQLAEIKQIVGSGMETILTNPRISPEQKKLAEGVMEKINNDIPWTQDDVIDLKMAHNEGKSGETLRGILKSKWEEKQAGDDEALIQKYLK